MILIKQREFPHLVLKSMCKNLPCFLQSKGKISDTLVQQHVQDLWHIKHSKYNQMFSHVQDSWQNEGVAEGRHIVGTTQPFSVHQIKVKIITKSKGNHLYRINEIFQSIILLLFCTTKVKLRIHKATIGSIKYLAILNIKY